MDLTSVEDLKPAPYNPREITEDAYSGLKASLFEFGDISGIVWNSRTGNLVTGHQRIKALKEKGATFKNDPPRFIDGNEVFLIRVVDWDGQTEKAANLSANNPHIEGIFTPDLGDMLKELESYEGFNELRFPALEADFFKEKKEPLPGFDEDTKYVVSLSGGKDSTAMLLMMLERKIPVHSIVFFDTGWEFPAMLRHIDLLEKKEKIKIWRLHPIIPFDYYLSYKPVKNENGEVFKLGYGWPSPNSRWCTSLKQDALDKFYDTVPNGVRCIGYAYDERKRVKSSVTRLHAKYPLIEWGITEKDALEYCKSKGYSWEGLYDYFPRVSCFCCPFKRLGELRNLRKYFPELWQELLEKDDFHDPEHGKARIKLKFRDNMTAKDFDKKFAEEEKITNNSSYSK